MTPGVVGCVDEHSGSDRGVLVGSERLADGLVLEHRRKAVGAQQQPVARLGVELVGIGGHVGIGAQRAGDDAAVGVRAALGLGQLASADHVGDHRVILGDARDPAGVQQVRARVAHLGQRDVVTFDDRCGHRRAHALLAVALARGSDDLAVGRRTARARALASGRLGA